MAILSSENIIRELIARQDLSPSFEDFLAEATSLLEVALNYGSDLISPINEAEYDKITKHLRLEILDVEKFIKVNEVKCVSNPRAFIRDGIPSDDGLLSNTIFGIGTEERAGTYGYIDLHGYFIDPSCYKAWIRLDRNIRNVVHGNGYYRIDERGQIVEDPAGKTGIKWLHSVMDRIKFEKKDSISKDISRKYLEQNRKNMWINKYIVIPPFYRDKNVSGESSRVVGLGGVNKLYTDLIVSSNALKETQDYLFDPSDAMNGRVQEILLSIYDWFCGNTNANIKTDMGRGLSGKFGLIQGSALSKTSNFTSRLVISAPELKVERPEDMMVTFEKSAVPISACMADFRDFVIYHTKKFFKIEFQGK
jgi:DNA-directed RNA polymerase beta' subunit